MTKTIEIPWLTAVTQADPDWQREERFVKQDERRKPRIDWRAAHPYDFTPPDPPNGYVYLVDADGSFLLDGDTWLIVPA